jgi:hypothetical protein
MTYDMTYFEVLFVASFYIAITFEKYLFLYFTSSFL